MKKVIALFLWLFSGGVFSASSGNIVYVDNFENSVDSASSLFQYNTGANNACGPTSALFVKNYYFYRIFKKSMISTDPFSSWSASNQLKQAYSQMGKTYNSTVSTDQLKTLASSKWGWSIAVKASGSNSIKDNLSSMIARLKENYPVILALKGTYPYNPVYGWDHIVVFYKYDSNANRLYFFDHYYGRHNPFNSFSADDATVRGAIQGNLPYLRIAP